jgi:hypothetical protein
MPITPGTPSAQSYQLYFTVEGIEFRAEAVTPIYDEGATDGAVQTLVDHLDDHPDIVYSSGGKGRTIGDTITLTP